MCTSPLIVARNCETNNLAYISKYYKIYPGTQIPEYSLGRFSYDDGKFVSNIRTFGSFSIVSCGKCIECLLSKRSEWSLRIVQEASNYKQNSFITLTYDDASLPKTKLGVPTLVKSDFQKFMKRLRFEFKDKKLRYYMCGEYGDNTQRPHYHLILFGYDFSDDRELFSKKGKHKLYTSLVLNNLWGKGHCLIAEVNERTAGYVAGYVNKKLSLQNEYTKLGLIPDLHNDLIDNIEALFGKKRRFYIRELIDDNILRQQEYSNSSLRPGIGFSHIEKFGEQYLNHGYIIDKKGRKRPFPRYYLKKLEELYPDLFLSYKDKFETREVSEDFLDKDVLYRRHRYRQHVHKLNSRGQV